MFSKKTAIKYVNNTPPDIIAAYIIEMQQVIKDLSNFNSISYYAKNNNMNVRTAQRIRERLNIGKHIDAGKNGVWVITEDELRLIENGYKKI